MVKLHDGLLQVRNDETGKFLKGTILHSYRYINFRWNHKQKNKAVHRLVAETFLPNLNNYEYVIHIDGNKTDNRVENLESVSHKENMRKAAEETNAWNFRKVAQYDLDGNLVATYLNASDAGRAMGILPGSMRSCIRLRNGRHKNFVFKWVEEDETSKNYPQGVE